MDYCRDRFRTVLVPNQIAADGSFPQELRRTKPYGYSLFNLDAMSTICQILSTPKENLWTFELPDGRGMRKAVSFMAPYIGDKSKWPKPPDVMYDQEWPMRHCSLLFAGLAFRQCGLPGALENAESRLDSGGSCPEFLCPAAGAVGLIMPGRDRYRSSSWCREKSAQPGPPD